MFRALGLHHVVLGSYRILASGEDLFLVIPDSSLPRLVNSQLVASSHLGFLIMFPYMPTLPDNPGVSRIQNESPGLPYGYPNLPDKSDLGPLHHCKLTSCLQM